MQWEKDTFDFELSKVFNKYGNTERLLDTKSLLGTFETSHTLSQELKGD